jgi:hypothetical protein
MLLKTSITAKKKNEGKVFALIPEGDLDLKETDLGGSRNWKTARDGRGPVVGFWPKMENDSDGSCVVVDGGRAGSR